MNFLFDTNMVAFFYDQTSENHLTVYKRLAALKNEDNVYISILTVYELEYSVFNADAPKRILLQQQADKARTQFEIIPLSYQGARIYGELKWRLKKDRNISRENIRKYNIDLMLASTAIAQDCILVSGDRVFETIVGINDKFIFQNWLI
ncbi:type II toxin-antitoxin system VapC family toxin [Candidatus Magnetobacterium casense]|uniref:type II toxin-antitoxin system VapC family toxin n=1 Tax=Candidatus Magnetobacterium casense TaxID=1455061 RepID=UPI00058F93C3|nr:type II toxin-antitoxin system VapC family toxin [Candidatus Magnetobacterium casensis]